MDISILNNPQISSTPAGEFSTLWSLLITTHIICREN